VREFKMKRTFGGFLNNVKLGNENKYENLTIYPILSDEKSGYNFLTVDEALANNSVKITETSNIGDLPCLMLKNKSSEKIFILDGDELIGSKQNRATNAVVLVPEKEELTIPVSCVERNRWTYKSKSFYSVNTRAYLRLRKKIFVSRISNKKRELKTHPQHDVWNDIDKKIKSMKVKSSTSAMNDIYKKYSEQLKKFKNNLDREDKQIGMIVMINNKVVSCEIFADSNMMGSLYDKILKSYAIDAIEESKGALRAQKTLRRKALKFLNEVKKSNTDKMDSVGTGNEIVLSSDNILGLALDFNDEIVYMSAYPKTTQ
jgi:hypothetical protein